MRLSALGARFVGVYRWPPGPANAPIPEAGLVLIWTGEEIAVRFATALDGRTVPAKRRGPDERAVRTGTDIETLTLAAPIRFSGGTLTITSGDVTESRGMVARG